MISCQNCETLNEEVLQKCKKCGFLIQNRIPNLDLFITIWKLLEAPVDTFKLVIRSEQKNYVLLFYYCFTSTIIFLQSWYFKLGSEFDNLIYFILFTQIISFAIFIPVGFLFSTLIYLSSKIVNRNITFKNSYAISGWSTFPLLLYFVYLIPIGLGIEGLSFFTHLSTSNSSNTYIFQILSGIIFLYYFILAIVGLSIQNGEINFTKICYSILQLAVTLSIIIFCEYKILERII